MSPSVTIEGVEHLSTEPVFVIPNRVDMVTLRTLEQALGGDRRITWLIEDSLRPGSEIMAYMRKKQAHGILCSLERMKRDSLAAQMQAAMDAGRHVVLLPGRPTQPPASPADVPPALLHYLLDTCKHPVQPVYIGMYNLKAYPLVTSEAPYEKAQIRLLPAIHPSAALAPGVTAAWLGAAADQASQLCSGSEETLAPALLHSLLEHPHAVIIDGVDDSRMSYRQLLTHAAPLARRLRKHTISKRLGIILPPGKFSIIANTACILAGITPVNIDYSHGETGFDNVARNAELTRFITEHRFIQMQQQFPWPRPRDILFIDDALSASGLHFLSSWKIWGRWMTPRRIMSWIRTPVQQPQEEALVVFSPAEEGSAARGASLSHSAVLSGTKLSRSRFCTSDHPRTLSCLPFHHRAGLLSGLVYPLLLGQDIVTYPMPEAGKRLCRLARQYAPTLAVFTPTQAANVLEHAQEDDFAAMRFFHIAGRVSAHAARDAYQKHKIFLCECYLPMESAMPVACNMAPPDPGDAAPPHTLSYGAPGTVGPMMPGTALRITDINDSGTVLPLTTPGLIWIKGASLASGYLDGKEPYSISQPHERWRCTGDVGYLRDDGLLVINGPRSRFSMINGELVSHEAVERSLQPILRIEADSPTPRIAVVSIPEEREEQELLVLLSTAHRVVGPHDVITIRYALTNAHRPSHWAPQRIVALRAIPTLPGGKVDYAFCRFLAYRALGITPP